MTIPVSQRRHMSTQLGNLTFGEPECPHGNHSKMAHRNYKLRTQYQTPNGILVKALTFQCGVADNIV